MAKGNDDVDRLAKKAILSHPPMLPDMLVSATTAIDLAVKACHLAAKAFLLWPKGGKYNRPLIKALPKAIEPLVKCFPLPLGGTAGSSLLVST
eukprot:13387731-Heterocapsa_arctica.AAC.1